MFEVITDFINSITAYDITIPLSLKIIIIIIVIVCLIIGAYFMRDFFDVSYMRSSFMWFIFVAILNMVSLLMIFLYYNSKSGSYKGLVGNPGKRGSRGKIGTSVTCSYCKNNIYLQKVRRSDVICTLSTYTVDFISINANALYFDNILSSGNKIAYDTFVNGIILGKNVDAPNRDSVSRFRSLMNPNSIAILLVKVINDIITKSSHITYGTFRHPVGKVGYLPVGDSVYGGVENFELNSFMITGNVLYPATYTKLVSFTSYNAKTGDSEQYSIWRPIGQNVNEPGFKDTVQKFQYQSLGDICRVGNNIPKVNENATIREDCLEEVSSKDLTLVFIYVGALNYADETANLDYTQTDSYLIQNKIANDVEIFSVWRTPLNTFLTNCNSQNALQNNTFIYNLINNYNDSLNEYGNVSDDAKNIISNKLQSIQIPKILSATMLCKHYEVELRKDIVYYYNKYKNAVPEFANTNQSTMSLGEIINKIASVIVSYTAFNDNLIKNANVGIGGKAANPYDALKEKHLPSMLLTVYKSVNDKLLTISVLIENCNTLLDIITLIFDNGLDGRIAINSDGIAEGGSLLNGVQESLIMVCKMLLPPNQPAYTIKDECLGTFKLDRDRESVIKEFTVIKDTLNKLEDTYVSNYDKYSAIAQNLIQYQTLIHSRIGQLCGHIDNYMSKIKDMNLEEFTTSRLKGLTTIYIDADIYYTKAMAGI